MEVKGRQAWKVKEFHVSLHGWHSVVDLLGDRTAVMIAYWQHEGQTFLIPDGSRVTVKVGDKLLDFIAGAASPAPSSTLTQREEMECELKVAPHLLTDARVEEIENLKGNEMFTAGDFVSALIWYDKAFSMVSSPKSFGEEEDEARQVWVACHLNRAACHLKEKRYQDTIADCERVLEFEGEKKNLKAHLRLAEAELELRNYDRAEMMLLEAQLAHSDNAAIKRLQGLVRMRREMDLRDEKKLYGKMLHKDT
ncbi:hypothetical protein GUITHDRAFT_146285 [Guillardia theta CCMP2712]|uniref:Uncharacterized protein n=1 Tax=Guillardia theta (strain CCMP2712) TaxID=905079 RepID=L1IHK1_GUITC|nr:hypothetical protein GUITHDRAFT_146285 [Guillardia theta CCMP2712]EKX35723.1 hypothetical protein GUITHDRAFT_146285 [Guillardia theta CCMP2712]|eukprot:XP_005822703.1 hypothetical protein GUITHDRAFT_146285 [Guillardia theta CCMP2712]